VFDSRKPPAAFGAKRQTRLIGQGSWLTEFAAFGRLAGLEPGQAGAQAPAKLGRPGALTLRAQRARRVI
ncbi:MAG: hypothetical protein DBY09_04935, partial [Selenomonadales bacterium]